MTRRIAVAGWFGSDNLGDELILRSLIRSIQARGAEPVAISIDPAGTSRDHGVAAVLHRHPGHSAALRRALVDCDAMAVAGGLVQSETSPWNIPFHASRLWAAPYRRPAAALGMGVGHVHGRLGRSLASRSLRPFGRIVVRDADSARRLRSWGLDGVAVGADPVVALEPEPASPADTMCVILRPANRPGAGTAAAKARTARPPEAELDRMARAIDATAAATGLAVRFVAFQAGRDDPIHTAVADRTSTHPDRTNTHTSGPADRTSTHPDRTNTHTSGPADRTSTHPDRTNTHTSGPADRTSTHPDRTNTHTSGPADRTSTHPDRTNTHTSGPASRTSTHPDRTNTHTSGPAPNSLHSEIARRVDARAEVVAPGLDDVITEVGRSRVVVTMRYHGAVAALLHGRPAVLLDSSPKMASLAGEAGGWAPLLDPGSIDGPELAAAVSDALDTPNRASEAREVLRDRLAVNDDALDELLDHAR